MGSSGGGTRKHELIGRPANTIIDALQERAKELTCLYRVHEICNRPQASLDEIFRDVIEVLPPGWQYPTECLGADHADGAVYEPPG